MKRTPNEIGAWLERVGERLLHGRRVKGSGSGRFLKSDVKDGGSILWEGKNTDGDRVVVTADMLDKARRAASGTQGAGDNSRWGMLIGVSGRVFALVELETWCEVAEQSDGGYIPQSKGKTRRERVRMSPMERRALAERDSSHPLHGKSS